MPKRSTPSPIRPPRLQIYFSAKDKDQTALLGWIHERWRSWRKRNGELADGENDMARDILERAQLRDSRSR